MPRGEVGADTNVSVIHKQWLSLVQMTAEIFVEMKFSCPLDFFPNFNYNLGFLFQFNFKFVNFFRMKNRLSSKLGKKSMIFIEILKHV